MSKIEEERKKLMKEWRKQQTIGPDGELTPTWEQFKRMKTSRAAVAINLR